MKLADVKLGNTYLCYIGGALSRVVATRIVEGCDTHFRDKRTRIAVRRENETTELPKLRSPAALRTPYIRPRNELERMTERPRYNRAQEQVGIDLEEPPCDCGADIHTPHTEEC
jgi:hypothetical protein